MRRLMTVLAGVMAMVVLTAAVVRAQEPGQAAKQDQAQSLSANKPVRVNAVVMNAKLIRQPLPKYPQDAKDAHVQGTVVLRAVIGKDGSVKDLEVISGPPMLLKAAMKAVKKWKYQPTQLNGEPVDVSTTISVVFTLGH